MRKRGDDSFAKFFALASTINSKRPLVVDTDSNTLALDNCSSFCLTNNLGDFTIGKQRKVLKDLLGLGSAQVYYEGTVRWVFKDDKGKVHSWDMLKTNYSPNIPIQLFLLQHWAQCNQHLGALSNTKKNTNGDRATLEWDGHICTVPLNLANVAFLRTASGY
jgi:hypothetical protein